MHLCQISNDILAKMIDLWFEETDGIGYFKTWLFNRFNITVENILSKHWRFESEEEATMFLLKWS